MRKLLLPLGVLPGRVVVAGEDPLGGEQALHAHGPARVDPPRGDANLRAKTHPIAVRKPGKNKNI